MTAYKMQVAVDGEWHDVSNVSDFALAPAPVATESEPEPMQTSFTMSVTVPPEGVAAFRELMAEIEREERAARLERARRRMWLRFPYRGAGAR